MDVTLLEEDQSWKKKPTVNLCTLPATNTLTRLFSWTILCKVLREPVLGGQIEAQAPQPRPQLDWFEIGTQHAVVKMGCVLV